jgi:plasmid stabilization system protein ParE
VKAIRIYEQVETDVETIWSYLAADDPPIADRFVDRLQLTFAQIGRHPGLGHRRRWQARRLDDLRVWRVQDFPNYLVIYRDEPEAVAIVAVLSGYRSLERILKRR